MSLENLHSWENQSLKLTHVYNTDVMLTAPEQTDDYMRRLSEIIQIAKNDAGIRPKLKYLLPQASQSEQEQEPEETKTQAPMSIYQMHQQALQKKVRTLTKKERAVLRNEIRRKKLEMELASVDVGLDLVNLCAKRQKQLPTVSEKDPLGTVEEQPWRSQQLFRC